MAINKISLNEAVTAKEVLNLKNLSDYSDDDLLLMDNLSDVMKFAPIMTKFNMVTICRQGWVRADVNGNRMEGRANDVVLITPGVLIDNIMASNDFESVVLCITNKALFGLLGSYSRVWLQVAYGKRSTVIEASEKGLELYFHMYSLVKQVVENSTETLLPSFRQAIVQSVVKSGLLTICNWLARHSTELVQTKKAQYLFQRFTELIQNNPTKHQPIRDYARQLCISPKYLSVVCRRASGKSAIEWIREYTLADIKFYLRDTNMTIKEISNQMGFTDSSIFGNYVRKNFGISPSKYRNEAKK